MPNIIEITDFHAPELDPYARLTQNQLRSRLEPEKGIFIAEHRPSGGDPDPLRGCTHLYC